MFGCNGFVRFFERSLDLCIRLFNVLAIVGVGISIATFILNLFTGMYMGAIISAVLTILLAGLLISTYKTGKHQIGYTVTIVIIFMILFPLMFF
ncbi:MAG: hypothetical protein SOZ34_00155 [Clostridia bacterium]|nr:hypothetical protein [Clostridia bacterium]